MQLDPSVNANDHARGPSEPRITLVEYGDYECPDCMETHAVIQRLAGEYSLRHVWRHFPKSSIHPNAAVAAQVAEAAGSQGQFWAMHDALMARRQTLGEVDYTRLALRLELEVYRFESELSANAHVERVNRDLASARAMGLENTPTFFINATSIDGTNEQVLRDGFERALNA